MELLYFQKWKDLQDFCLILEFCYNPEEVSAIFNKKWQKITIYPPLLVLAYSRRQWLMLKLQYTLTHRSHCRSLYYPFKLAQVLRVFGTERLSVQQAAYGVYKHVYKVAETTTCLCVNLLNTWYVINGILHVHSLLA